MIVEILDWFVSFIVVLEEFLYYTIRKKEIKIERVIVNNNKKYKKE